MIKLLLFYSFPFTDSGVCYLLTQTFPQGYVDGQLAMRSARKGDIRWVKNGMVKGGKFGLINKFVYKKKKKKKKLTASVLDVLLLVPCPVYMCT